MKKNLKNIKNYWEERAKMYKFNPKRATTDDFWLKNLEIKAIKKEIDQIKNKKNILDIGCGDGFSTLSVAKSFPKSNFIGGDYSQGMIENAKLLLKKTPLKLKKRIDFQLVNVTNIKLNKKFDVAISDRCIINMPDRATQEKAIKEISSSLKSGGHYIMVENFIEGHHKMNQLRKKLKIKEIPVRWHNLFLDETFLKNIVSKFFTIKKKENISSLYYLITRIIYSKICKTEGKEPNYDNIFYKIALDLDENCGNFGPINLVLLKKK